MRLSRLYVDEPLVVEQLVWLNQETSHYLLKVLRLRMGTLITLFNGQGGEYSARLVAATKKTAQLQVETYSAIERESALSLTLVQALSRPEHMDYTIQKSVELGVQNLVPVITERSPPLDETKINKREQHWRKIIISACEQCGRNRLPQLYETQSLNTWLARPLLGMGMVLSPNGNNRWHEMDQLNNSITVLIGAEGGLSEAEIQQAQQAGYLDIRLGPRILRTETAAVAVLAVCQAFGGDWG